MAKCVAEQIADQVFTQLALVRTVASAFGRRELEKNAAANRVVAVPLGASVIREPDQPGDKGFTDAGRQLYVREFSVEWHCHGVRNGGDSADFAVAEGIYLDTLRAIRYVAHAAVQFSDEKWQDQQEGADSFERLGSVVSFVSTFGLPIYEAAPTRVTLTADPKIETTVKLPGDGTGETVTINENGA